MRDLDSRIAVEVMESHPFTHGLRVASGYNAFMEECCDTCGRLPLGNDHSNQSDLAHYSTRIEDAWKVVDHLLNQPGPNGDYHCILIDAHKQSAIVIFDEGEDWEAKGEAPTLPEAICLAALSSTKGKT